uniref:restriction endonuclease subunit S n=1 Tax=Rummeliibacillus suwonensis TaxID=1306154 RepID=UPI00289EDC8E|nr:restriction endonuclease subunit S [Rummeliibacillus suwonensis]
MAKKENIFAWEQRKLGDIKDVRDGTHDSPKYHNEGFPLVTSKNLTGNGLDMTDVSLISEKDFQSINKRSKVDVGDIIFGMIGTIGNPVIVDREGFAIKNIALIKHGGEVTNNFLIQLLKSSIFKQYIQNENAGNTQKFLGLNKIRDYQFLSPSYQEQILIGNFLKQLDFTLALLQDKLIQYQKLKKAFLQLMFPQNGESVPQVRFANFSTRWEQRKLGEISEVITKGTTPKDKSWTGEVNYVKTESIDPNSGNISVTANTSLEEHKGYLKRSQLKADDVLFSIVGTLGRVGVVNQEDLPANTNQQIAIIRLNNADNRFVFHVLKTPKIALFIKSDATIGAQPSLSLWQINGLEIPYPSIEEQKKISGFLDTLDHLIALYQSKLDQLKKLKSFLLQKMFV